MWRPRAGIRIRVYDSSNLIIVRILGSFEDSVLSQKLVDLTDQRPETALFRMILDFRFSEGVIKDTESERVRDYRHQMKLKLGHGSIPDGPHAIIGSTDHSSSAMVDSHKELYPNTELCQTTSVEDAWNAVMGAIQMPEPIRVFFK